MKKTIDGVPYDSECGFSIGSKDVECYPFNTTSWAIDWLIRSPTGHFFIFHEWSATSARGLKEGAGEDITPLKDIEEVRSWLKTSGEFKDDSEINVLLFPEQWELAKDGRSKITVTLSNEIIERIQEDSTSEGVTMSWVIDDSLRAYYNLDRS